MRLTFLALILVGFATVTGCQAPAERKEWALAIHGGAGVISKNRSESEKLAYQQALGHALAEGRRILSGGGTSLDAVETVVRVLEDDPNFNAGRGAVFTNEERCELDASIMNGADLQCGAVSAVTTVKNPISLARRVMEQSRHVFFVAAGAEAFADAQGVERVPNRYFQTDRRRDALRAARRKEAAGSAELPKSWRYGTVGAVALDQKGNLAAATSTGGLTNKKFGRVGDSPIIGAGTYANNASCGVSCTGTGELFIRHGVARDVSARMLYGGVSAQAAADTIIHDVLSPGDGGLIAVDRMGTIVFSYNSEGMFRAAADAKGRFEVGIWEEMTPPPSVPAVAE